MIDLHIHSSFSADSTQDLEEIIKESIKRNIDIISITDHIDYDYTDSSIEFEFNILDYLKEVEYLQKKYSDKIKILKGIELGLQPHLKKKLDKVSKNHRFDFIIGSFHTCDKKDLYLGDYYKDKTDKEAWDFYLDEVYETINEFDNFSVIGHLDIIKRYSDSVREVDISYYKKKLKKIFKLIIDKNIGLEVNTSGLRKSYGLGKTLPSYDILKIYNDCGGKLITIGSDSHSIDTLASNYNKVVKKLNDIGFKEIYYFENMKPKIYKKNF